MEYAQKKPIFINFIRFLLYNPIEKTLDKVKKKRKKIKKIVKKY